MHLYAYSDLDWGLEPLHVRISLVFVFGAYLNACVQRCTCTVRYCSAAAASHPSASGVRLEVAAALRAPPDRSPSGRADSHDSMQSASAGTGAQQPPPLSGTAAATATGALMQGLGPGPGPSPGQGQGRQLLWPEVLELFAMPQHSTSPTWSERTEHASRKRYSTKEIKRQDAIWGMFC